MPQEYELFNSTSRKPSPSPSLFLMTLFNGIGSDHSPVLN
nr:MAG TPA: hypothetical protein [Crassvirales sp.]